MGAQPFPRIEHGWLSKVALRDYGWRFLFGASISAVAGVIGAVFGPRLGGAFLAFPAIMPAAVTLVDRKDGHEAARDDCAGGILGSVGLIPFAIVASSTLAVIPASLALAAAASAWFLTSNAAYFLAVLGGRAISVYSRVRCDADADPQAAKARGRISSSAKRKNPS
jgi:hypothetical protein